MKSWKRREAEDQWLCDKNINNNTTTTTINNNNNIIISHNNSKMNKKQILKKTRKRFEKKPLTKKDVLKNFKLDPTQKKWIILTSTLGPRNRNVSKKKLVCHLTRIGIAGFGKTPSKSPGITSSSHFTYEAVWWRHSQPFPTLTGLPYLRVSFCKKKIQLVVVVTLFSVFGKKLTPGEIPFNKFR